MTSTEFERTVHPDDVPPLRDVTAGAISTDGTTVEQAYASIAHASDALAKHVTQVDEQKHLYSDEGYTEQIGAFRDTAAAKAVDRAVEKVESRRQEAESKLNTIRRNLSPEGDAAAETRANRYWTGAKDLLDSFQGDGASGHRTAAAEKLFEKATRSQLGILLEELPRYLAARGNDPTWIEPVVQRLIPEYASAQAQLKKAESAALLINQGAGMVKRAIDSGRPANAQALAMLNPTLADRMPTDRTGKLAATNGGRYDPDK